MVMTPIDHGAEAELRAHLEAMSRETSTFAQLPRTHFGRWVILDQFVNEDDQPKQERLASSYLIFTSNFDGDLDSYLDELCSVPADATWGRCAGCPRPASGDALKRYLLHNQIKTGLFYAAYGDATVPQVVQALDQRERMIDFAVEAQGLEPDELQRRFRHEFCG
jgi:hypothetical protein